MHKNNFSITLFLTGLLLVFATITFAQEISNIDKTLIIGTKEAAPFSMKNADGTWSGISIDLWREIAARNDISYKFKEYDLKGLLLAVENGEVDLGIAALTITPGRERAMDFSHAFYSDGLGIAIPFSNDKNWMMALRGFFSLKFLSVIAALAVLLFSFGCLLWFFEKEHTSQDFDKNIIRGLADGFWWSAVTMTTVGYGDKSPKTLCGRLIALVWMFTSIIIISSFTAAITSSITVSRLESSIRGLNDLSHARIATVPNSTSAQFLQENNLQSQKFDSLDQCLKELKDGEVDAVVYDAPLLQYMVQENYKNSIKILPQTFDKQSYGMAFPSQNHLREKINTSMLDVVHSRRYNEILSSYLGGVK